MILAVSGLLAGCSMYSVDESAEETDDQTEEETVQEEETTSDIEFKLQESEHFAQVSPLNDDGLRILSDHVEESDADDLAPAGEVALDYSGVYLSGEETIFAMYLMMNRTNVDMTDIAMEVSHQTSDGEDILDHHPIYLGEEMFGVLEQDTAMPVYIEMDGDQADTLEGLSFGTSEVTLDNFTFDTKVEDDSDEDLDDEETTEDQAAQEVPAEEEEDSGVPAGYNLGYHPGFVLAMRQEEQMIEDIEAGNVPDLSVETPPVLMNDPQGGEIMNIVRTDEIVNPASGFSQEGELTLFWTGISTGEHESTIFLLANRSGQEMSDFTITVDFATSEGGVILDEEELSISQAEYGTLPNDSLTPIVVDIPGEVRGEFGRLLSPGEGVRPQYNIVEVDNSYDTTEEAE